MSKNNDRRPILYNGETYAKPVTKSSGGGPISYPLSFEESKSLVLRDIASTRDTLRSIPESDKMPNERIISVTVHPDFTAKSYYPVNLFDSADRERFGLKEIGSRVWRPGTEELQAQEHTKMFFVRADDRSLSRLEQRLLGNPETVGFQNDIRKISSIGVIGSEDQIMGLPDGWTEGQLEAVLHPFDLDRKKALTSFLSKLESAGVDSDTVKYKQYASGITFVSFKGNRNSLNSVTGYNPLRTLHPIQMRELPSVGRSVTSRGPGPAVFTAKPSITVGVIDGGVHDTNPYISNYTISEFSVPGSPIPEFLDHGTRVTGAVLFGPLNGFSAKDNLMEPTVSVKSFGVLSSESGRDPELYSAIDAIEKIVPAHSEIKVYNLSLGPNGPILDDSISRFTYALDLLSYDHDVLFCVAVGNDGEMEGYDRIQSPADSVNSLSVGAYTKKDGVAIRAPYSSIGPGREGCKMKPDLLAFGGCDNHPIHLVANTGGSKILGKGTSFASPIVAGMAGRLVGGSFGNIDALTAKSLLIHSTSEKSGTHTNEMGHGILPVTLSEIVDCKEKSYTLIYRGKLESTKYAEFPIPWDNSIIQGNAVFKWTVAVMSDIDHLSTDDYTSSAVEIAFYPNSKKYKFTNKAGAIIDGKLKKSEIVDLDINPERGDFLISLGFVKGTFPDTGSAKLQYKNESELRSDLKWDSLDTREVSKKSAGIRNPAFHIHAMGRGTRQDDLNVKYALILTVTTPKATSDIYSSVINSFPALLPIEMEASVNIDIVT